MSENNILDGRTEKAVIGFPETAEPEAYDTNPIFRVMLNVSYSRSMGVFQKGYYIEFNDSLYYIVKKSIEVKTNTEAEKVLEFLKRTHQPFTVDIICDKTLSNHQFIECYDVTFNTEVYTVRDYVVHRGLWQEIEGQLFENKYSPGVARFTDERLVWYAELWPEHPLLFTQTASITLNYIASQGHLEVYKIIKDEHFVFPAYLYTMRKNFRFYNHYINGLVDVIPLGAERRIVSFGEQKDITSDDHDTIHVDAGQYLLFHPLPRRDGAD